MFIIANINRVTANTFFMGFKKVDKKSELLHKSTSFFDSLIKIMHNISEINII